MLLMYNLLVVLQYYNHLVVSYQRTHNIKVRIRRLITHMYTHTHTHIIIERDRSRGGGMLPRRPFRSGQHRLDPKYSLRGPGPHATINTLITSFHSTAAINS